jgi:hypothetical protein
MLVTQNIDGLHSRAGTSPDRLVELHGTISMSNARVAAAVRIQNRISNLSVRPGAHLFAVAAVFSSRRPSALAKTLCLRTWTVPALPPPWQTL